MIYEVYDPHPHICHKEQYQICKNHTNCPLYNRCLAIQNQKKHDEICKRDCPTCIYAGCSMSYEDRKKRPLYREKTVQDEMLDLNLENTYTREQIAHKQQHEKLLYFYKTLFGTELQRRAEYRRRNNEFIREKQNQKRKIKKITEGGFFEDINILDFTDLQKSFLPCKGNCFDCEYDDCIVEEADIQICKKKAYNRLYYIQHQDQIKACSKKNKDKKKKDDPEFYKKEYQKYRKKHLENHKIYYQTHKKSLQEYHRKYREEHSEELKQKKAEYRNSHREELRAKAKEYYHKKKESAV